MSPASAEKLGHFKFVFQHELIDGVGKCRKIINYPGLQETTNTFYEMEG